MPNDLNQPGIIVVCGPTASGKTHTVLELAKRYPLEAISADSRQVYRRLDIGTAKPTTEELASVRHHLIDVVEPDVPFSVADFIHQAHQAIAEILQSGRMPVVVGGTGLYILALTEGLADIPSADLQLRREYQQLADEHGNEYLLQRLRQVDPVLAARLYPGDQVRIIRALEVAAKTGLPLSELQQRHQFSERPYRVLKLGLAFDRGELYERIDQRVEVMFQAGLVDEVRGLLGSGYSPDLKGLKTIGYREVIAHLQGEQSLTETIALVQRNSRRYAKRQLTWFRRDSSIIWVDPGREFVRITELIDQFNVS